MRIKAKHCAVTRTDNHRIKKRNRGLRWSRFTSQMGKSLLSSPISFFTQHQTTAPRSDNSTNTRQQQTPISNMPIYKGIKISIVSQWELKIHPEFARTCTHHTNKSIPVCELQELGGFLGAGSGKKPSGSWSSHFRFNFHQWILIPT